MANLSLHACSGGRRSSSVLTALLVLSALCGGLLSTASDASANPVASKGQQQVAANADPSSPLSQMEAQIWRQLNQARRQSGLEPLKWNPKLAQIARTYSQQMAQHNFYGHTGMHGENYRQRVEAAGIKAYLVGENLMRCRGCYKPSQVVPMSVNSWLKSAGHRHNIMLPMMKETGIGIWQQGNSYYMTQLLIEPKE